MIADARRGSRRGEAGAGALRGRGAGLGVGHGAGAAAMAAVLARGLVRGALRLGQVGTGGAGMGDPRITGSVRRSGGSGAGPHHARHYFLFRAKSAAGMRAGPHATARASEHAWASTPTPACTRVGIHAPPRAQMPVSPVDSPLLGP